MSVGYKHTDPQHALQKHDLKSAPRNQYGWIAKGLDIRKLFFHYDRLVQGISAYML